MKTFLKTCVLFVAMFAGVAYACPDPMPENTMCVRWQPPTENVDGSTIPDTGPGSLASYRIFYSLTQGSYNIGDSILVNDGDATEFTVNDVQGTITVPRPPGGGDVLLYVVMTATNTESQTSQYSNTVSMTVTFPVPVPGEPVILEAIINVVVS